MKFLIDRCAGRRLAEWLRTQGHDVLEARTFGPDPGDQRLSEIATEQGRVLVTIDTDFGRLIFLTGSTHRGIVRLPDAPAAQRIDLMEQLLARHASDLDEGAVITARGGRVRISRQQS